MKVKHIAYKNTGYFSKLICDYLDQNKCVSQFYNNFPTIEGFRKQIGQKTVFDQKTRDVLVAGIHEQNKNVLLQKKTRDNIEALLSENTFTITTGHQLNLFTGPIYFLYKIITAIKLAEKLTAEFSDNRFVPVYWMASEDHDFEEIKFFNFKGKKISWDKQTKGAVGRISTVDLDEVLEQLNALFGNSEHADELKKLFSKAYLQSDNLANATRVLVNELFGSYGLVIIDGDAQQLKATFSEQIKDELIHQTSFKEVSRTNQALANDYPIQVNPRPINLFYLKDDLRERILIEKGRYRINETSIEFSQEEILEEVKNHPDRFSPNVIMRPLYQEAILPNICYIGGGGELAYWLQLKSYFDSSRIPMPILLLRNSVLFINKKQLQKLEKLNLSVTDIFQKREKLVNQKIKRISDIPIDFSEQRKHLLNQFAKLKELAAKTDRSFTGAVNAQEKKQLNGLEMLEKRLLKAQKRKLSDHVNRIRLIHEELFPNQSLEERHINFSKLYLEHGKNLIPKLYKEMDPLDLNFKIITG